MDDYFNQNAKFDVSLLPHFGRADGFVKLGLDCMQFGLSLKVKRCTKIRVITLPPNFA